jgi:hypothetical protein
MALHHLDGPVGDRRAVGVARRAEGRGVAGGGRGLGAGG